MYQACHHGEWPVQMSREHPTLKEQVGCQLKVPRLKFVLVPAGMGLDICCRLRLEEKHQALLVMKS